MSSKTVSPVKRSGGEVSTLCPQLGRRWAATGLAVMFTSLAAFITAGFLSGALGPTGAAALVGIPLSLGAAMLFSGQAAGYWRSRAEFQEDRLHCRTLIRGWSVLQLARLSKVASEPRYRDGRQVRIQDETGEQCILVNYPWRRLWLLLAPYCAGRRIDLDLWCRAGITDAARELCLARPDPSE